MRDAQARRATVMLQRSKEADLGSCRKLPSASIPSRKACSLAVATTRYARGDLGTPLLDEDKAGCQGTGGGQATTMVPTPFTSSSMVPSSSAEQV